MKIFDNNSWFFTVRAVYDKNPSESQNIDNWNRSCQVPEVMLGAELARHTGRLLCSLRCQPSKTA